MISIVRLARELNSEHLADAAQCRPRPQTLSVNVVYTRPEATAAALRAAESFARDLETTIHIRAMIAVPRQLAMDSGYISIKWLAQTLDGLVKCACSNRCEFVLHIHLCRSRIDALLTLLKPYSLLVIGGRRRLWPSFEGRLCRAVRRAGHSIAFVDPSGYWAVV